MIQPLEETTYCIIEANGHASLPMTETELLKYIRHTVLSQDARIIDCKTQIAVSAFDHPLLKNVEAIRLAQTQINVPPVKPATPAQAPAPASITMSLEKGVALMQAKAPALAFLAAAPVLLLSAIAFPHFHSTDGSHTAASQLVNTFGELESATNVKIDYPEYRRRLVEGQIAFDQFASNSVRNEAVVHPLCSAIATFSAAGELWQMKLEAPNGTMASRGYLSVSDPDVKQIVEKYGLQKDVINSSLDVDFALSHLWNSASGLVDEARSKL